MKVYLVFRAIIHEGWDFMKVFDSSKKAWAYKEYRDSLEEPSDVSYVVQEEVVQ